MSTYRSGHAWRALALYAVPGLLLAAIVLPTVLLWGRLPGNRPFPVQDHPINWGWLVQGYGAVFATMWCGVVILYLAATPDRSGRRRVWEMGIPILTMVGATAAWLLDRAVLTNAGRTQAVLIDSGGAAMVSTCAVLLLGAGIGLLLGRRAMAFERAGEPRPAVRVVWMREVSAGPSWWLLQAIVTLIVAGLSTTPEALHGGGPHGIAPGLAPAGLVLTLALWTSAGRVTVSPAGVRVRRGRFAAVSWQLRLDQIVAVETATVRLLSPRFAWRSLAHLLLRDGPALVIHTRRGGSRWVTVPDADVAAALLAGWLARRGPIAPAGYASDSARSM